MKNKLWFENWFDTPYYHILYKNRDFKEAERFISNLATHLSIAKNSRILDLACGKGRHAYFLSKMGFDVTGIDLSEQSISWAKENYAENNLAFSVHDMRMVFKENHFDYLFNLFTSFGYFDTDAENQLAINAMKEGIKSDGLIIIDFLNRHKVINTLVPHEIKEIDGISFTITKTIEDEHIIKGIEFSHGNKRFSFQEKVKALSLQDFQSYFKKAGLHIKAVFGDYNLADYDQTHSDRLIMVLSK